MVLADAQQLTQKAVHLHNNSSRTLYICIRAHAKSCTYENNDIMQPVQQWTAKLYRSLGLYTSLKLYRSLEAAYFTYKCTWYNIVDIYERWQDHALRFMCLSCGHIWTTRFAASFMLLDYIIFHVPETVARVHNSARCVASWCSICGS